MVEMGKDGGDGGEGEKREEEVGTSTGTSVLSVNL